MVGPKRRHLSHPALRGGPDEVTKKTAPRERLIANRAGGTGPWRECTSRLQAAHSPPDGPNAATARHRQARRAACAARGIQEQYRTAAVSPSAGRQTETGRPPACSIAPPCWRYAA